MYMEICKEKKGPEFDHHIKLYRFFHGKNFPVEIFDADFDYASA